MEFYSTNLAADIFLPKMVAGLLSHPKRQFHPSENDIHFTFITKIPVDNLLTKMPAESSRLVPLRQSLQCLETLVLKASICRKQTSPLVREGDCK